MGRQQVLLKVVLAVFLSFPGVYSASAETFLVENINDSGAGSLRKALEDANITPGTDLIQFNIAGSGVHTIAPLTPLPAITEAVTIDGYTQPGSSRNALADGDNAVLLIELNGANAGAAVTGLVINASNVTISGLVINRFSQYGISLTGASSGLTVSGNFIGTNPSGTAAGPGNAWSGILLNSGAGSVNTIGGELPWQRNVISGNAGGAIALYSLQQASIKGNYIGTNAAGTAAVANNGSGGILVMSSGHTIGGKTAGARNLISGNNRDGIYLANAIGGGTTQNVVIEGNYIGTDYSGTTAIPNFNSGIYLSGAGVNVNNNRIGGTVKGSGNIIAGNGGTGITLVAQSSGGAGTITGNVIEGNFIGVNAHGAAIPNNWTGVWLSSLDASSTVSSNIIGGSETGANVIAYNIGNGVKIAGDTSTKNAVLYNSIFSNTYPGIDLGGDLFASTGNGVTFNDAGDTDAGPNNYQNFPVLGAAQTACGYMNIRGTLNSAASTAYTIQLFANTACDGSGNGEGATYIGQTSVTTNVSGNGTFSVILPDALMGNDITATATDPFGNMSEFSACVTAGTGTQLVVDSQSDIVDASPGNGVCATAGGSCTLRAAVQEADAVLDTFTCISLPAGLYALGLPGVEDLAAAGDLDIRSNIIIRGAGSAVTNIWSTSDDRAFEVDPAGSGIAAALTGVNIWGMAGPGIVGAGGAVANNGTLLLERSIINSSNATFGGGLYNQKEVVVNDSWIYGNTAAFGGGIYTKWGKLTLDSSTISNNTASAEGAGINLFTGSTVEISNSTFSGNTAQPGSLFGGAINAEAGILTIRNSTIAGTNYALGGGAGIRMKAAATGTITNSIIVENTGGNCTGPNLTSGGYNLTSDSSCGFAAAGDITSVTPNLGVLADNGGPTWTHALLPGSPALDAGNSTGAPAADQRGIYRPQGTAVDIGAYEYEVAWPVRIMDAVPVYYPTIQEAYAAAASGETVETIETDFPGDLDFNRAVSIILQGGYAAGFGPVNTVTTVTGRVTVHLGSVTIGNLQIQ